MSSTASRLRRGWTAPWMMEQALGMDRFVIVMRDGKRYPLDTPEPRQEFEDMKTRRGRWSDLWVEVLNDGSKATYVARDEIARVEVDLALTASDEVAAQDEAETRKREFRKRAGIPHDGERDPPAEGGADSSVD